MTRLIVVDEEALLGCFYLAQDGKAASAAECIRKVMDDANPSAPEGGKA